MFSCMVAFISKLYILDPDPDPWGILNVTDPGPDPAGTADPGPDPGTRTSLVLALQSYLACLCYFNYILVPQLVEIFYHNGS